MPSSRTPRPAARARALVAIALGVAALVPAGGRAAPGVPVPRGYRLAAARSLGPGLSMWTYAGATQRVRVARLRAGSRFALRAVPAGSRISGPRVLRRTSTLCRRVRCAVAVNGDFFSRRSGLPRGGVVARGEPLRSSARQHLAIAADGTAAIVPLELRARLRVTYPPMWPQKVPRLLPQEPDVRKFVTDGLNVARRSNRMILYTPRFGPRTRTRGGAELALEVVEPRAPVRVGRLYRVRIAGLGSGNARIAANRLVLSGTGSAAQVLRGIWRDVSEGRARASALLRITAPLDAVEAVGGRPVLVRDGVVQPIERTWFARSRHPRTVVGWTRAGDLLLVTADGRQRGARGWSLLDAARFMRALGAAWALNLDGGGSTTFVSGGRVRNRPSDGIERAVAVALAVVRR